MLTQEYEIIIPLQAKSGSLLDTYNQYLKDHKLEQRVVNSSYTVSLSKKN